MSQQGALTNGTMTAEELTEYIRCVIADALAARQAEVDAEAARYAAELIAENDALVQRLIDKALATATVRYVVGFVRRDYTFGWLGVAIGMIAIVLPSVIIGGSVAQEYAGVLGIAAMMSTMIMGLAGYAYDLRRNRLSIEPLITPIPLSDASDEEE